MDPKSRNFRYFKGNKHKQNNNKQTTKKSNKTKIRTKSLKKQIHDTQRLLFKNILCEEGVKAQQEKLAKLKESFYETKRVKTHNKKLAKYKGIKFFDKSKILKKLTSLDKLLTITDSDEKEDKNILEKEFNLYKRYLNYVTYFPADRKYISLFPTSERLDPGAQEQLDAVIQETDSRVKQGLYADTWVAHVAKTLTSPVHVTEDITSPEINEDSPTNPVSSHCTAAPLFIPIAKPVNKKATHTGSNKQQFSKKLDHMKCTDTSPLDSPIKLPPTYDNDICEVECGDDLNSDSFFFFDTKGSKVDTNIFKNRPQKRNFQDTHPPKRIPNNSRPNSRNTRQKDKHRGQS